MSSPYPPLHIKKFTSALYNQYWREKVKNMSLEERKERDDRRLWHALRKIFTRKEFVTYENLPTTLQEQIHPFDEFIYPG